MQYRIGDPSDFYKTPHTYVFWHADYDYNSENCCESCLCLSQPICKILQNVPIITCRTHQDTYFLLHTFFSTIDLYRYNIDR